MSRSRRAAVEAMCNALVAGDPERIGRALAPDALMYGTVGGIDEGLVLRGRDAVVAYFVEIGEPWERLEAAVEAVHENGDVAVAFLKETARSTHTDVPFEASTAIVFRVRHGHVVELRGYMDRAKALAAAGLGG